MAAVVAQSVAAYASSSAAGLTTAPRTTAASGSLFIVLSVWERHGADTVPPAITDNKGNTYTNAGSSVFVTQNGYTSGLTMAWCKNAVGGSNHTFTQTKTDQYGTMIVLEVTGYDTDTPIESFVGGNDTSSPWLSPAVVTTANDALIIAAIQAGDCTSYTPQSPATILQNVGYSNPANYWGMAALQQAQATAGSITPGFSGSGGFQSSVIAFAIRAAATGTSGSLAATLDASTLSASGVAVNTATLAATLDASTLSASGVAVNTGTLAVTLADTTLSTSALSEHVATFAATLGDTSLSASAASVNSASLAVTLDDTLLDASTAAEVDATLAVLLDNTLLEASVVTSVHAALAVVLAGATLQAIAGSEAGDVQLFKYSAPGDVHLYVAPDDLYRYLATEEMP